ncbi:DUF4398 domain-containing protein [Magnetospirillum sp. UT-4]|uniref:DUF4398 domain-containing protein n=1 Tax=Magnetospirillum sp. UT-4 TaxID=2681467 RepID=UPI001383150C|nr:DUF4398 domain-containing protein [Magnetospirillum sp. UT-4]CAA7622903.1 conserved exported hypothetical protein [Magnetospirillum sp. UT-4]
MRQPAILAAAALALAACASDAPPQAPLARAEQAIRSAEGVGAAQAAPLPLRIAQERLAAARSADDEARSRRLADEAVASAELAQAQAQAARSQQSLADLRRSAAGQSEATTRPGSPQ